MDIILKSNTKIRNFNKSISNSSTMLKIVILTISICYGLVCYFTPYQLDDLVYLLPYRDIKNGISSNFDINIYFDFFTEHYLNTNGRLGDKLLPLLLLLPKSIFALITSICIYISLHLCNKIIFNQSTNFLSFLALLCLIVLPPWYNHIFVASFNVNYIWSMALNFIAIYYFFNSYSIKNSILQKSLILFAAFLAGTFHEVFSVPLLCGFAVYFVVNHKRINRFQIYLTISLLLGTLFLLTAPGFWNRVENSAEVSRPIYFWMIVCSAYFLSLIITVFVLFKQHKCIRHKSIDYSKALVFFTSASVNFLITIMVAYLGPRTFWAGQIFSIITIFLLLNEVDVFIRKNNTYTKCATIAIVVFLISHCILCVKWQLIYYNQHNEIISLYHKSKNGLVYYDVKAAGDAPLITLRHISGDEFYLPVDWWIFSNYYFDNKKTLRIVPKTLENKRIQDGEPIPSNRNIYKTNGILFAQSTEITASQRFEIECKTDKFGWITTYSDAVHYTNSYGEHMIYILPYLNAIYYGSDISEIIIHH